MADTKRLVVIDPERTLRDQLDRLAELRIYGTNASDVVRVLVARTHAMHFDGSTDEKVKEKSESG